MRKGLCSFLPLAGCIGVMQMRRWVSVIAVV